VNILYLKKFIYKLSIIILSLFANKNLGYNETTEFDLIKFPKDGHEIEYIKNFNLLKAYYSKDLFFESLLKEISIISYDYTNKLNDNNCKVHIMVSLNNKYIYPLIVSITSALINSNINKTTLIYHILCSKQLRKKNINKLKSLLQIFPTNLEMIFYNMGDAFIKFKNQKFSQVTYYRLLSPIFIPLKRIIYLDSDTLIFHDLFEMFQLSFKDNYVLGFLDIFSGAVDYLGLKSEKYINAGIILINLEKIRKDRKHYELLYMALNHKNLKHHDQTIINYVLYPNIGILPCKYGIFNYPTLFDIKYIYLKNIRQNIDLTELKEAIKDPTIMHFVLCYPKVWFENSKFNGVSTRDGTLYNRKCEKFHKIWMKYAKLSPFFKEIKKKYRIKN
jgi:lipopolysaccharide biosynthesis glycosyltransferase